MEVKQLEMKLYLKCKRLPIVVILDSENPLTQLIEELNGVNEIIRFGNIVFKKEDFKRIEIK